MEDKQEEKRESSLDEALEQLAAERARGAHLAEEIQGFEKKLARGTRDGAYLAQQVERVLRERIATTEELARELGRSRDQVYAAIKAVRAKVYNLGTPDRAVWTWKLGSGAAPRELRALVERLIRHEPMEFREIVAATGARDGLIQGHLVELRKTRPVFDYGHPGGRARWFIPSEGARDARLPRRESTRP